MRNYQKFELGVLAVLLLGLGGNAFCDQKILIIVESSYLFQHSFQWAIDRYVSDIIAYDHKKAEVIGWDVVGGDNYVQCSPLWQRLQDEYFEALAQGDNLEGAVLIGNIPVPQIDPAFGYEPLDQVYMDIVDSRTDPPTAYSGTPFNIDYGGHYTKTYSSGGRPRGDTLYDIWISRINAQYLNDGIRQGGIIWDEYSIYYNYLDKLHNRMTAPATVPSRGFAMGGPENLSSTIHSALGQYLLLLNLPWLAEFTGRHNSSYNWMSQMLAGPRGCINYGAFNGTLFPNERNRRYCRYNHLDTVYLLGDTIPHVGGVNVSNSDSLGWEWAGVYGHSHSEFTDFYSNDPFGMTMNGRFRFGTLGPFWGANYLRNYGYNGTCYYYQDSYISPNPYNRSFEYKDKVANWRWIVSSTKVYNVYIYYEDNPNNCDSVDFWLYYVNNIKMQNGTSGSVVFRQLYTINQKEHKNRLSSNPASPDYNWELCFTTTQALAQDSLAVCLLLPRMWTGAPSGDLIADAVRFRSTDSTVDVKLDNAVPDFYSDVDNNPSGIFSTNGFFTSDETNRAYEDMGNESGGGGYSKSQFFLTTACEINNFIEANSCDFPQDPNYGGNIIVKNLGNLYALGHNGLICMGTADVDGPGNSKAIFTTNLRDGKDFGEAYLAHQQSYWTRNIFVLLGAGNLRSQPYVQFGADIEQNMTITTSQSPLNLTQPILIQNVTVNGAGNWDVTSNNSATPPGTHSEIVVRPETDFAPTGSNEVHLKAN
jgi:hypothetical protein